ncbi:AMP-binding protein [Komagataeibacter xylinus]|uniref:AMP-binding protein n=1 Tax=Komagataeibacter xylinus TaxID=28448 RepID=UPI00102FF0D2|nr:AMP-binding protein [Komagataeibacter xylinus]
MTIRTDENVFVLPAFHARRPFVQLAGGGFPARMVPWPDYGHRVMNVSALCVDRHLGDHAEKPAILCGRAPDGHIAWRDLHERVCRLANALTDQGVQRGDVVAVDMPLMVESIVAVLACIRIGAVHVLMPEGLDAPALAERLADCGAVAIVAGDGTGHAQPKAMLDRALAMIGLHCAVRLVLVVAAEGAQLPMKPGRDHFYNDVVDWYEPDYPPAVMHPDAPFFLLHAADGAGRFRSVTYTAGEYSRLLIRTTEMLVPQGNAEIPYSLLDMAWKAGQTALVVNALAKGATITNSEGALAPKGR